MSALRQMVDDYLAVRRSLGHQLRFVGLWLIDFASFMEDSGNSIITTDLALSWANAASTPRQAANRLAALCPFAEFVRTLEPRTEVPSPDILPCHRQRPTPYIYSEEDVRALMEATRSLHGALRPLTYRTLIGLLATTGMRIGEARALDRADFDDHEGGLLIRRGKFGKSREVLLHPTTTSALLGYAEKRNRVFRRPQSDAFFISEASTRLQRCDVAVTWVSLVARVGLADRKPRRPRVHDLRHSFAVRTLVDWYRKGLDVQAMLPRLSTYLGHVKPSSTYWYLTAIPELVGLAAERLDRVQRGRS